MNEEEMAPAGLVMPAAYSPTVHWDTGTVAGTFANRPKGIILHGSRSGKLQSVAAEYNGTRNFAASGIDLGWNVTVGDDVISIHMPANKWGWNARGASSQYLAVEFAQPLESYDITDGQVRAFCWWVQHHVLKMWGPSFPLNFPTHAELPEGQRDGKSDVFSRGSARTNALRERIMVTLGKPTDPGQPQVPGPPDFSQLGAQDLRNILGYLTVDVFNAFQRGIDGARKAKTPQEIKDALDSIQAANNTLRRGGM